MTLLSRVFFTLPEAAARWGCTPADIAGWVYQGELEIVAGITPVTCGDQTKAGFVAVPVADLMPMFRRTGTGPSSMPIHRIREQGEPEWHLITSPAEGIEISIEDLLITADEARRFEAEHEIFGKPHAGRGPDPKYDWDAFWRVVAKRIYEQGVPETLKQLTDELSDWFVANSATGDCPSDSVIRKRLSPLWHDLRRDN